MDKFKGVPGALSQTIVRLQPSFLTIPGSTSIGDVASCVDAFKNLAYPFSGPTPCL